METDGGKGGLCPEMKRGKTMDFQKTVENSAQSYTYYSTDSPKQQVFHIQFFHFSTVFKWGCIAPLDDEYPYFNQPKRILYTNPSARKSAKVVFVLKKLFPKEKKGSMKII